MSRFLAHFTNRYRSVQSDYTQQELDAARRLVEEKFATPEWTYRVP